MFNAHEFQELVERYEALNTEHPTPQEKRSMALLLSQMAAMKQGKTRRELDQDELNEFEKRQGLPVTNFKKRSPENAPENERRILNHWLATGCIGETRTEVIGQPPFVNTSAGELSGFVPETFYSDIRRAMAQTSPLWNRDCITLLESNRGGVTHVPLFSDTSQTATLVSENTMDSEADIATPGGTDFLCYNLSSPKIAFSVEADEDVEDWSATLATVLGDRVARSEYLLNGTGAAGQPLGLVTSVVASAATFVASGSSANDGTGNTGSNSIGSADLAKLYFSVNAPYRRSAKAAWLMNSSTLQWISGNLVDKVARPLVDLSAPRLTLMGAPILIDEGMESIGAGNISVLYGALDFWITKIVVNSMSLKRYWQAPGLVENAAYAVRLFLRAGGTFCFNGAAKDSPVWGLQHHS